MALIEVSGVWREYHSGDTVIAALKNVDLKIESGEFLAIIGQSGSGKSTLMNILGCLDRATRGSYKIGGHDTATMSPDELSALRREYFGFIFQRYHLLTDLDARGNVEAPAIYAGWSASKRKERALALLNRLGLSARTHHKPNALSGGQQQRVSVARALMNGGEVILADEPTGALDSASGAEMLRILEELSAEGHTVIIVTHDPKVAAHAHRIIEIMDGEIIADRRTERAESEVKRESLPPVQKAREGFGPMFGRFMEAFKMAVLAMNAHRMRTFLTMLGIIIGIASVVSIFALGQGARQAIINEIAASGTNTMTVYPGANAGDENASSIITLTVGDAEALAKQPYADSVTPVTDLPGEMRFRSITAQGIITGVGDAFFRVRNMHLAEGRFFRASEVTSFAQVVVIDDGTAKRLFGESEAMGQTILMDGIPSEVIGVLAPTTSTFFAASGDLQVYVPYTTAMSRILHQTNVNSIIVRMTDTANTQATEAAMTRFLTVAHGNKKDFYLKSSDAVKRTIDTLTLLLSLLIGAVGGISLVVGGIGVMNIMLVSVSERTKEIGVRSAIGARRSDIMSQFIIEAVLVCLLGGAIGVGLAVGTGFIFSHFVKSFQLVYTPASIIMAFAVATAIGLGFGWLPARNASRLDPVEALARD